MDLTSCHLLLDQPGSYALVGEPLTQAAVKRLKLAVFGSMESGSMYYSLRVYCVDDTPHAFQVRKAAGLTGLCGLTLFHDESCAQSLKYNLQDQL